MRTFSTFLTASAFMISSTALGSGDHDHPSAPSSSDRVGPDQGILEHNEKDGFKLSAEALKNFELQFVDLSGNGPWVISKSGFVHSGEGVYIFRLRQNFFKRIDFKILKKSDTQNTIISDDLRENDQVVIAGVSFLRIAELAVTEEAADGHSH